MPRSCAAAAVVLQQLCMCWHTNGCLQCRGARCWLRAVLAAVAASQLCVSTPAGRHPAAPGRGPRQGRQDHTAPRRAVPCSVGRALGAAWNIGCGRGRMVCTLPPVHLRARDGVVVCGRWDEPAAGADPKCRTHPSTTRGSRHKPRLSQQSPAACHEAPLLHSWCACQSDLRGSSMCRAGGMTLTWDQAWLMWM